MGPLETNGGVQIAGTGVEDNEQAVVAAPKQLFTGLRVGLPTLTVQCCGCGTQLGEGDQVSVYAYRTVETSRWHLARCRCTEYAPDEIATQTLGTTEVRVNARLTAVSDAGTQQHGLCLAESTVSAVSSPQDETAP